MSYNIFITHLPDDFEEPASELTVVVLQPYSETRKCIKITAVEDKVIEGDESFTLQLVLQTTLPISLQSNMELGTDRTIFTIHDTSK